MKLIVFSILFFFAYTQDYYRKITISNPLSETLIDEEICITIDTETLHKKKRINSTKNSCLDVLFIDSKKNVLTYFVETLCGIKETKFWVKVPEVFPSGTNTIITMQYAFHSKEQFGVEWNGNFYHPGSKCNEEVGQVAVSLENSTFNGRFFYGSRIYGGYFDSSDTHKHTFDEGEFIFSEETPYLDTKTRLLGTITSDPILVETYDHTHLFELEFEENEVSHIPPYMESVICQSKRNVFPDNGFYIMTDNQSNYLDDCDLMENMNGKFVRGGGNYEIYGGSKFHEHFFQVTFLKTINQDVSTYKAHNTGPVIEDGHEHPFEINSTKYENLPPYVDVFFCKNRDDFFPEEMTVMTNSIPPLGYEIDEKTLECFPRGTTNSSKIGQGSTLSTKHVHNIKFILYNSENSNTVARIDGEYLGSVPAVNHTHEVLYDTKPCTIMPSYSDVVYVKRKTNRVNLVVGEEYSYDSNLLEFFGIMFGVTAIIVCIILFALVIIVVIVLIFTGRAKKKLQRYEENVDDIEVLLEEQKLGENTPKAKIKINKELFVVDHESIDVKQKIGKGGSNSVVFKAIWQKKEVAFKVFMTEDVMNDQGMFGEFEKEVEILLSLSHPNILQFYGASLKPPRVGFIMEYCENGDLGSYIQKNPRYPIPDRIRILVEVSAAMNYLHGKNIIHRDLKPENVLLTAHLVSKLMDFGLSKALNSQDDQKTQRIGTTCYMAPEVVRGGNYNEMCDVFSFAMLTYVVVTGNDKPYGEKAFNVEGRIATDSSFRPKINPRDFQDCLGALVIIKSCWQENDELRPSFDIISKDLQDVLDNFARKKKPKKPLPQPSKKDLPKKFHQNRSKSTVPKIPSRRQFRK